MWNFDFKNKSKEQKVKQALVKNMYVQNAYEKTITISYAAYDHIKRFFFLPC